MDTEDQDNFENSESSESQNTTSKLRDIVPSLVVVQVPIDNGVNRCTVNIKVDRETGLREARQLRCKLAKAKGEKLRPKIWSGRLFKWTDQSRRGNDSRGGRGRRGSLLGWTRIEKRQAGRAPTPASYQLVEFPQVSLEALFEAPFLSTDTMMAGYEESNSPGPRLGPDYAY
jgi:hypothetical protein